MCGRNDMEKTQTPVRIDWVAEENPADYNFVNTSRGIVLVLWEISHDRSGIMRDRVEP